MRPTILYLIAAFLVGAAAEGVAQKVGTSSFQFLKVMPTARATAMGEAFVTLAGGADAVFWNPAGLTGSSSLQAAATYTSWLFDTKQSALACALPLGEIGTVGAQFQLVDYGDIEETNVANLKFVGTTGNQVYNPGLTGNTFSPSAFVVGLSFARNLTESFSAGVTAKLVHESLYDAGTFVVYNPATGAPEEYNTAVNVVLFDFGMHYNTGYRSVQIGGAVQNFGAQVKYGKEGYPAPLTFRLGVAADLMGEDALLVRDDVNRITIAYDLFQPNDYAQQMHIGVEYGFDRSLALRAGYKVRYDSDGLTLGAGVNTDLAGVRLSFDYSYGRMGEYLGTVHRISVGATLQ